jgi:hypothetical protein
MSSRINGIFVYCTGKISQGIKGIATLKILSLGRAPAIHAASIHIEGIGVVTIHGKIWNSRYFGWTLNKAHIRTWLEPENTDNLFRVNLYTYYNDFPGTTRESFSYSSAPILQKRRVTMQTGYPNTISIEVKVEDMHGKVYSVPVVQLNGRK